MQNKRPDDIVPIFLLTCFILFILLTACSERDLTLEEALSVKLEQFKKSNAPTMNLNDVLGENWKKVCVQWPYATKESFNEVTGEQVNHLFDISENETVFWVFYNDDSIRAAIINRNIMDFVLPRKFVSTSTPCTSEQNPYLYAFEHYGNRGYFYFHNQ